MLTHDSKDIIAIECNNDLPGPSNGDTEPRVLQESTDRGDVDSSLAGPALIHASPVNSVDASTNVPVPPPSTESAVPNTMNPGNSPTKDVVPPVQATPVPSAPECAPSPLSEVSDADAPTKTGPAYNIRTRKRKNESLKAKGKAMAVARTRRKVA